jgi:hypothetical protein
MFLESFGTPTEAVDEKGNSLVPASLAAAADPRQPGEYDGTFGRYQVRQRYSYGGDYLQYSVRLHVPPDAGRRVASLKGAVQLWLRGKSEKIEIADIKTAVKNRGQSAGSRLSNGMTFQYNGGNVSDNSVNMSYTVQRTGGSDDEWSRACCMIFSSKARVLDSDGNEWGTMENMGYGGGGRTFYMSIYINKSSGKTTSPAKLVIEVPTEAVELKAPYELKNLPLP